MIHLIPSDSTTIWLLAIFSFFLAWWFIDIALQCRAWLRDRRLRAQLDLARRHPDVASASPARPNSDGARVRTAPAKPAGILTFQIEQAQILRPKPNGHAPNHHDRNPIEEP